MLKSFKYFSFNQETYQNLGRVIQIIRVTLCPDQAGLIQFMNYLDLTQILHWMTCINKWCLVNKINNQLSVAEGNDGSTSDSPQYTFRNEYFYHLVQLEYFDYIAIIVHNSYISKVIVIYLTIYPLYCVAITV